MTRKEKTLDPADWEQFRSLSHRMVDDILEHLKTLPEQPAWRPYPESVKACIADESVPRAGQGEEAVYEQFKENVLPYRNGNLHPRFSGWVQGNGTPLGMMADMLASAMNPHMAGFNQAPATVEFKVIDWIKELLDFPSSATGILLSGGSMANLTGLTVARNAKAGFDVREEGLQKANRPLLTVYGSTETHGWAKKAVELLGMGHRSLRLVACNSDFTLDIEALKKKIEEDREAGCQPIAVLATAGTVNTGASDDLNALADFCKVENLWLHVDAAYGAFAYISPKLRHLVAGIERADSIALDLHKWMYLPFEIACVLVRDGKAHKATFNLSASYLATTERGVIAGGLPFADLGYELTRGFKALKAWMSMKAYGIDHIVQIIEQNVDQAQYLVSLVNDSEHLELVAPAPMNVVCFRFILPGKDDTELNAINEEILLRLQERGIAVPSQTVIDGRFAIRSANVNHRTTFADVKMLADSVARIGLEMTCEASKRIL